MCLAVPLKIVEIDGLNGVGEVEGLRRRMRLDFIKEPRVGEYVIVHAGFAIERLGEEQAKTDIAEWNEVRDALAR